MCSKHRIFMNIFLISINSNEFFSHLRKMKNYHKVIKIKWKTCFHLFCLINFVAVSNVSLQCTNHKKSKQSSNELQVNTHHTGTQFSVNISTYLCIHGNYQKTTQFLFVCINTLNVIVCICHAIFLHCSVCTVQITSTKLFTNQNNTQKQ